VRLDVRIRDSHDSLEAGGYGNTEANALDHKRDQLTKPTEERDGLEEGCAVLAGL
jgi:hypothetical protein